MNKIISDLHMHSTFSDGFWSVEKVIFEAKKRGLQQISITDHNAIGANSIAREICKQKNIEYIDGVEIDAKTKINDTIFHNHILAYNFEEEGMNNFLKGAIRKTTKLFLDMIAELKHICEKHNENNRISKSNLTILKNYIEVEKINYSTILQDEYKRKFNKELSDKETTEMLENKQLPPEIISRFIKNNLFEDPRKITNFDPKTWKFIVYKEFPTIFDKQYEEKYFTTQEEVIEIIKKTKGIAIMAHPLLDYPKVSLEHQDYVKLLEQLIKLGLDGLETYFYSNDRFSKEEQDKFNKQITEFNTEHKLLTTYGTDCHGPKNNNPEKIYLGLFGSKSIIPFSSN